MDALFMLAIAAAATFTDLRSGRISNGLILTGFALGICWQAAVYEGLGILMFLGGAGLPVILLGGLFYLRMLGAGDIKLLAVMGGFLGISKSLFCTLAAILAGGAISFLLVLMRRNFRRRIQCLIDYCREFAHTGSWKPYDEGDLSGGTFCFSIPILISVLLYMGGAY